MNNDSVLPMQKRQIYLLVAEFHIYSKRNWRKDWITDTRVVAASTDFRGLANDARYCGISGRVFVFKGSVEEFIDGRSVPIDWPSQNKNFEEVFRFTYGHARAVYRHLFWGHTEKYPYRDGVFVHEEFRHLLIEYFI